MTQFPTNGAPTNGAPTNGAPTTELPRTAQSLPFALLRAREHVMAPVRRMLAESGVTEQQWRVLRVLAEHGAQDASQVAARASLQPSSLTRIVQSMTARGLMTRRAHAADRRRQVLAITALGQGVIDAKREHAGRIAAGYRARLGAEDYDRLLRLLDKLASPSPQA